MRGRYLIPVFALAAHAALGQGVTVRGVAWDSLHARPLAGALISLGAGTTTADSLGRFRFDGVAPGTYRVTAQHDAVDRLGMSAVGAQARVTDGREIVRVAIPSFSGLWRLVCGEKAPASDTGFVFGTVRAKRRPVATTVSVSWIDLVANGAKVSQKLRTMEVDADSLGNFAACGVPTSTGLTIRAAADSAESGRFDIGPMDKERVIRRDLALGAPLATAIAAGRGASISGTVLADSGGGPIANAEVTLVDADIKVTTAERGEFAFKDLIPGTHRIHVRKIGYGEAEFGVDVEEAEKRERHIVLSRITLLDSIAVVGKPLARDEQMRVFEEHRKLGLGKFLTVEDLEKARGQQIISLVRQWPAIYFPAGSPPPDPVTRRGIKSINGGGGCKIKLLLDGVVLDIPFHQVAPERLAGLEYYPGPSSTPAEYNYLNTQCGLIVMHSRYKTGK